MDSNCKGFVIDPQKCGGLPLEEKRKLAREVAQWPDGATEILSAFSRQELLEIICAEMGKVRKYSGYTKPKMIEHLLKVIAQNTKRKNADADLEVKDSTRVKKQRNYDIPLQMPTYQDQVHGSNTSKINVKTLLCPNLACKASLSSDDGFCKRCSCCVCHKYDDNKDPSVWLTCDPDLTNGNDSCGMSCHLKCALKHERSGIAKNGKFGKLDGRFYCVSCGKINDIMSTWRKQLLVAKEARRVDVLCLRISLGHKILDGTERYKDLHRHVDTAAKKLKKELGPLDRVCERMARGIVNRLSCGAEVQKLCASALEAYDAVCSQLYSHTVHQENLPTCQIRFEESFPTSVVVILEYDESLFEQFLGCRIWHRNSTSKDYPENPTYIVLRPEKKFKICDLQPCMQYICKVSLFSCSRVFGTWEATWITPSVGVCASVSDEQDGIIDYSPWQFFRALSGCGKSATSYYTTKVRSLNDISAAQIMNSELMPTTPSKVDGRQDHISLSNDRETEMKGSYEYCVKVVKSLERNGHLKVDFRVKFLTWFSLKATMQERRIVNAFVDTMADDPPSLAQQLLHTFADVVCNERTASLAHVYP